MRMKSEFEEKSNLQLPFRNTLLAVTPDKKYSPVSTFLGIHFCDKPY